MPTPDVPRDPEDEFGELCEKFRRRLVDEKRMLVTLTEVPGRPGADASRDLSDLREFAHRLRGAALVFGFLDLGSAAKALELAALQAASNGNHEPPEAPLAVTIHALALALDHEVSAIR